MPQQTARWAARDSWKSRALHEGMVAQQGQPEPPVLLLLRVVCSDRAAAVVAEAQQVLAVQAVQAVAAQVAAVAVLAAVHTRPALVVSVVLAGHWFWSFDHAAICCC